MGRNWLSSLRMNWKELNILQSGSSAVESLLAKYVDLFQPELGTFQETTVDLRVSPDAQPKFYKARAVPYILKEKIENELDRLLSQGVIEPVQFAK